MPLIKSLIRIKLPLLLLLTAGLLHSCKKEDDKEKIIYGTLSLQVKVMHHTWGVPNIPVYLKKNAIQYPGPDSSVYELSTIADSDGIAVFEKLYPGKYYLMAKGYDYYFGAGVIGSIALNLSNPVSPSEPVQVTLMVSE